MAHPPTQRVVHHGELKLIDVGLPGELHRDGVFPDPPLLVDTHSWPGIVAKGHSNVQTNIAASVIGSAEKFQHEAVHHLGAGLRRSWPHQGPKTLHRWDFAVQPRLL